MTNKLLYLSLKNCSVVFTSVFQGHFHDIFHLLMTRIIFSSNVTVMYCNSKASEICWESTRSRSSCKKLHFVLSKICDVLSRDIQGLEVLNRVIKNKDISI